MFKKIISTSLLIGILGLIGIGTIKADISYEVDSHVGPTDYFSSVSFSYGGNDFDGLFRGIGSKNVVGDEGERGDMTVMLDGRSKICHKQVKGYYYNNQRGNRVRPLDSDSLAALQEMDRSYENLVLSGGLWMDCDGVDEGYVYGEVSHYYEGNVYELVAGVGYDYPHNMYTTDYSGSLKFKYVRNQYALNGYVRDMRGGIGKLISNVDPYQGESAITSSVAVGNRHEISKPAIYVYGTGGLTGYVGLSGVTITVQGSTWNGTIIPPNTVTGPEAANLGETGMPSAGTILLSVQAGADAGVSLVADAGEYFILNFVVSNGSVGQVLDIYRSSDGATWERNSPDGTCTLDISKMCYFRANHLSYFSTIVPAATPTPPPSVSNGGGGGGGVGVSRDNCLLTSYNTLPGANKQGIDYSNSFYDRTCIVSAKTTSTVHGAAPKRQSVAKATGSIVGSPYTKDLNDAYLYAYKIGLTTAENIKAAGMKIVLTRKEMAKLVSLYGIKVLGLQLDAKRVGCDSFEDTKNLPSELRGYILSACQLGLMGLDTTGKSVLKKFNPNDIVTRAQFGTIFSRLLWDGKYNGGNPYYQNHLAVLKSKEIITNTDPSIKEYNGYVMLMMMRADQKGLIKKVPAVVHTAPTVVVPTATTSSLQDGIRSLFKQMMWY